MYVRINNETVGISAEVAIANVFGIYINDYYRARSNIKIKKAIEPMVLDIFNYESIPYPNRHVAEGQNPIDFILEDKSTLSVKSNQKLLGKVAPQTIGQPTAETYFDYIYQRFSFDIYKELDNADLDDTYENRSFIFKCFSIDNIDMMLSEYWKHLFECNYYLHFYNILKSGNIVNLDDINYLSFNDVPENPIWDKNFIAFTQSLESWNESNTVKYYGITLGEFQVHRNRNCFKFRFNMSGVKKLLEENLI